jgi:hypothetical protein
LPDFEGIKLAHDTGVCALYRDLHKIEIVEHDLMLFEEPGRIGFGGNSGFQALNIAVQFGAVRVLLIGFDMHAARGMHWYGPNTGKDMRNPLDTNFVRWRKAMSKQAKVLRGMGIEVVNASLISALDCFEIKSVERTLTDWKL